MDKGSLIPEVREELTGTLELKKALILKLGRKFEQTVTEFCRAEGADMPSGVVLGALKYVENIVQRRMAVVGNYWQQARRLSEMAYDEVIEPFAADDPSTQIDTNKMPQILTEE